MDRQKNNPTEKIFHSNAYARIAHGSSIGSTDTQTFRERLSIHRNRQAVGRYGNSLIGQGYIRETARADIDNPLRRPGTSQRQQVARGVALPRRNPSRTAPRPSFREPPGRGYNPFG